MMQPITLYSHEIGPNAWKVAIILSALGLEYKTVFVSFEDHTVGVRCYRSVSHRDLRRVA